MNKNKFMRVIGTFRTDKSGQHTSDELEKYLTGHELIVP